MDVYTEHVCHQRRLVVLVTLENIRHYYRTCVDISTIDVGLFILLV